MLSEQIILNEARARLKTKKPIDPGASTEQRITELESALLPKEVDHTAVPVRVVEEQQAPAATPSGSNISQHSATNVNNMPTCTIATTK
jgi:hypothetical protein